MKLKLTRKWDEAEAKRMLSDGASYTRVASYFGTTTTSVRCWVDLEYAAFYRLQVNERRRSKTGDRPPRHSVSYTLPPEADSMARLAEIPEDTRTLTQRICGDPLPGRDALSRAKHS